VMALVANVSPITYNYRMARYVTEEDEACRAGLRHYLEAAGVGRNADMEDRYAVSVPALDARVARRRGQRGLPRRGNGCAALYAMLDGTRTARPEMAFDVGEALRECGTAWSSGLLALYAAGYLGHFYGLIGVLASKRASAEQGLAIALTAWRACGIGSEANMSHRLAQAMRIESNADAARGICAAAFSGEAMSAALDSAWRDVWLPGVNRGTPERTIGEPLLRAAFEFARMKDVPLDSRESGALTALDAWARNAGWRRNSPPFKRERDEFEVHEAALCGIAKTLRPLSRIASLPEDRLPVSKSTIQSLTKGWLE
jgi:hypothetical protein